VGVVGEVFFASGCAESWEGSRPVGAWGEEMGLLGRYIEVRSADGGVVSDSLVPEPHGRSDGGELRVGEEIDKMEESRGAQEE